MNEKIVKGVYMDSTLWDELEKESRKTDRSTNWMIVDILKKYFKNNKTRRARARKK